MQSITMKWISLSGTAVLLPAIVALAPSMPARAAKTVTVQIAVKNHRFVPAEVTAPAHKRLMLRVKNHDSTPMELESESLRVEKVVVGGGDGLVRVRPLAPGRYEFFDDFHRSTTGALVVK